MPVVKPSPQDWRPRLDDKLALNGILFVLCTGIAWEGPPQEQRPGFIRYGVERSVETPTRFLLLIE